MAAVTTLLPVFFMLALGLVAHRMGWVTPEQKAGTNTVVFTLLFPIMIFNALCGAAIDSSMLAVVGFVFVAFLVAIVLGRLVASFVGEDYAHFAPYLLTTVEGGSVALPLYTSLVGPSSNTVIFDLAGIAICFIVVPILVSREGSKGASPRDMVMNIFTNSFVIAVIAGLVMNFTGLYGAMLASPFGEAYTTTVGLATQAITPMILFCLGYDFSIDKSTLAPLIKLSLIKTAFYGLVIAGFFLLFPNLMADKLFMMAVLIYFTSPTGAGLVPIISPLFKRDGDASFASAFIPLYLVVTLVVYTFVVVFVA